SEMHRAGLAIGSHTKRHVLLTNEAPGVTVDEIAGSRRDLERGLGAPVRYFAYPDGRFNSAVVSAVADAGYQLAVTACGHRESGYPLLTVPRRLLWEHATVDAALRFSPSPPWVCAPAGWPASCRSVRSSFWVPIGSARTTWT